MVANFFKVSILLLLSGEFCMVWFSNAALAIKFHQDDLLSQNAEYKIKRVWVYLV